MRWRRPVYATQPTSSVACGDSFPWEGSLSPQEGNIYPDFIRTFY